jgi:hypothetical protein
MGRFLGALLGAVIFMSAALGWAADAAAQAATAPTINGTITTQSVSTINNNPIRTLTFAYTVG